MGVPSGYTSGQVVQAVPTGINSALVLINSTTFTTAASVSLPANTFSATYDNYLVIIQTSAISTTMSISGRFRAAGTDNTSSEYSNMFNLIDNNAGGNSSISNNSQSSFALGTAQTSRPYQGFIDVTTPFLTQQTCIHPRLQTQTASSLSQVLQGTGRYQLTNSFDSFSFICSTGTFTGTIRAYGYANS